MRIASYTRGGQASYGVVTGADMDEDADAHVVDVPGNVHGAPDTITGFLKRLGDLRDTVMAVAEKAESVPLDSLDLLPVIPDPGNILCIGVNYREHASETATVTGDYPVIFAKVTSAIWRHGSPIRIPAGCSQPDYEAELGVVIGTEAKNVAIENALDHVAGYFAFNDVSARDFQNRTSQWVQGKSFDTFAPTGPFLVTADEIPDPQTLDIRLTINGEVMQQANTTDMIFDVKTLVSYLSTVCTLRPGDIIATGTPSGIGAARTPQRFLKPGDVVRVEIDRLPTLENPVEESQ